MRVQYVRQLAVPHMKKNSAGKFDSRHDVISSRTTRHVIPCNFRLISRVPKRTCSYITTFLSRNLKKFTLRRDKKSHYVDYYEFALKFYFGQNKKKIKGKTFVLMQFYIFFVLRTDCSCFFYDRTYMSINSRT